jgi:hypothetical protein
VALRNLGRRLTCSDSLLLAGAIALSIVHVAVLTHTYHFGSFDDDASYVMAARGLAHLHGLNSMLPVGLPLVSTYPAGYPALLAPLVAIWNHDIVPLRALSALCSIAVIPLTWLYLRDRLRDRRLLIAVLLLLALNPVFATYGSMVMAEQPYLVVMLLVLLALDRWVAETAVLTRAGVALMLLLPFLVWLKQAGLGFAIGCILYLAWRRQLHKALATSAATLLLLLPLVVARLVENTPVLGSRYSSEIGDGGQSLMHRLTHLPGQAIALYWRWAVPNSVLPTGIDPMPTHGFWSTVLSDIRLAIAPIVLLGIIAWAIQRRGDAAIWATGFYWLETLLFPFTNERRIILVLPLVLAWLVLGVKTVGDLLAAGWRKIPHLPRVRFPIGATAMAVLVGLVLVPQFPRNYLLALGRETSRPTTVPSLAMLQQLGAPSDVVDSDYIWTTSLVSGHQARNGFFNSCYDEAARELGLQDKAVYVLTSGFANIGIGNPCALQIASRAPWAVRLYRTQQDLTAVFALIGPRTMRPHTVDLTRDVQPVASAPIEREPESQQLNEEAGDYPTLPAIDGTATLTWDFPQAATVSTASIGSAFATTSTSHVQLQLKDLAGQWVTVATAQGGVGEGQETPFLLSSKSMVATAMRAVISGTGTAQFHDVHALGTPTSSG